MARDKPQCHRCPKLAFAWTAVNRGVYTRWRFFAMGADVGVLDHADYRRFLLLDDTDREIAAGSQDNGSESALAAVLGSMTGSRRGRR